MRPGRPNVLLCFNCLKRVTYIDRCPTARRTLTTAANPTIPPRNAFASLPSRRLISLHGPDAPKYLQGLVTANVPSPRSDSIGLGFYSAFLNASGRVLHDVFIYPTQHSEQWQRRAPVSEKEEVGYLIEVDANEVEALAKHLRRFKLRAKIGVRILDEGAWRVYSAWGTTSTGEEIRCQDRRVPSDLGLRILMPADTKPDVHLEAEEATGASYDLRRIMLGVPEGQNEIVKEAALPQESNIDYMGGIDFRKGCYVGQELTIRTHHTGVVRKRILSVQLYRSDEKPPETLTYNQTAILALPPHGTNISRVDRKGRSAGKWLGGVGNVGLALCRLEVMTETVLTGEGSQSSPNDEFKVAWDGEGIDGPEETRVKAFVPEWHKERAEEQRVHRPNG
ncbi:MAG: hypothetical protein Q9217_001742 [Psora testacea]